MANLFGLSSVRAAGLICFVIVFGGTSALYTSNDAVVMLKDDTFTNAVVNYDGVSLVEFFAPWCGHCQTFAPQYKKIAEKLKGIALVAAVDCNDEGSKKTCRQYQVQSFPTIQVFPSEKIKNPYTGDYTKEADIYVGPRTLRPILESVEAHLTAEHIANITSTKELEAFKAEHAGRPKVVLYSNKEQSTMLYNGLSTALRNKLAFALVRDLATEVVEAAGVTTFPTLHVIKADGETVVYDQEMKAPKLKAFLDGFTPAESASKKAEKELPLPSVTNLTTANLTEINAKEDMWLIAFYAASAEECQVHIARYLKVLRDLQGMVNTALLQVSKEEASALPEVYGLDTAALVASPCELQVVLFPFGEEKSDLEEYEVYKGETEGKALQKWVAEKVPDFTTQINADTMAKFLTTGMDAGTAGGIKVMLYTNKEESPPTFRALANSFRNRAKFTFGYMNVNSGPNKAAIKVAKVPMLALAMPIMKDGNVQLVQEPYTGPLKVGPMHAWLEMMARQLKLLTDDPEPVADDVLPEFSTTAEFQEHCGGKPGLCVIGLMHPDHPKDSQVSEAMAHLALDRDEQPLHFSKVNALRQPHLTAALGVMRSDLPTVAIISPKRLRFVLMTEEVTEEALGAVLDAVLAGKARTEALQELPTIVDGGVEPGTVDAAAAASASAGAAGEQGGEEAPAAVEEPIEEEFDLSDIMSEDISGDVGAAADKLKEVERQLEEEQEAKLKQEKAAKKEKKKQKKKGKKGKKGKKSKQQEQGEIKDEL